MKFAVINSIGQSSKALEHLRGFCSYAQHEAWQRTERVSRGPSDQAPPTQLARHRLSSREQVH